MVGSIDPRCETVRGTHWPNKGRVVVWSSRRGNHLGQRSKATASTGRTYGCKRSDQTLKNSCGTGAVHIWVPAFAGTTISVFTGTTRQNRHANFGCGTSPVRRARSVLGQTSSRPSNPDTIMMTALIVKPVM
jgi:hypothetical protein